MGRRAITVSGIAKLIRSRATPVVKARIPKLIGMSGHTVRTGRVSKLIPVATGLSKYSGRNNQKKPANQLLHTSLTFALRNNRAMNIAGHARTQSAEKKGIRTRTRTLQRATAGAIVA
jgi:hypothetical protein